MIFYEENPGKIGRADVVIAIPTFNEARNIAQTIVKVTEGVEKYLGGFNAVLINCDNNSTDGTKEIFFNTPSSLPKIYLSTPPNVIGKGSNLKNLFLKARELEAQVVIVLECDIENLSPYWIRALGQPVLKGAAFVHPLYVRHKYESPLSSAITYPLTRCLYGRRVRQLDAGDVAFSGDMVETFLGTPVWNEAVEKAGIDVWMSTVAMRARVPICQSVMNLPKIHRIKDPYGQVTVRFVQILSVIFELMIAYRSFWEKVKWSKPTILFSFNSQGIQAPPPPVEVSIERLYERFLRGFDEYQEMWQEVFDKETYNKLQEIKNLDLHHFSFPSQTWATILFDGSIAYRDSSESRRPQLLRSFLPLYFGKVVSFVKRTERMSIQQAEDYVEATCEVFEESKPYLIHRWR